VAGASISWVSLEDASCLISWAFCWPLLCMLRMASRAGSMPPTPKAMIGGMTIRARIAMNSGPTMFSAMPSSPRAKKTPMP
jgi:hypothetical protein